MWLLEKTVGHKHPCQSDMEALASVPPQICLCHVSCVILHLPGPRQQVASLSHIASWGSNQRNWHLVCTSWFIPTTKGNSRLGMTYHCQFIQKSHTAAFPIASIGNLLSPDELRIAIALRTGANIFKSTECRCGKFVDRLGLHGLSCIKNVGHFPRH